VGHFEGLKSIFYGSRWRGQADQFFAMTIPEGITAFVTELISGEKGIDPSIQL
jgi:hypothetical protein